MKDCLFKSSFILNKLLFIPVGFEAERGMRRTIKPVAK
jgi:hypothetical protein